MNHDIEWQAGELGCGDLVLELRQRVLRLDCSPQRHGSAVDVMTKLLVLPPVKCFDRLKHYYTSISNWTAACSAAFFRHRAPPLLSTSPPPFLLAYRRDASSSTRVTPATSLLLITVPRRQLAFAGAAFSRLDLA